MTITTRLRIGGAIVAGTILCGFAAPALAAGPTTTGPTVTDPAAPTRLSDLKAKADAAVKDRVASITTLTANLNGVGADCGQNADVVGQLANASSGLQALDATIQAETNFAKAVVEFRQIFIDYRIYLLQTPKTNEVVACDRVSKADAALASLEQKVQARIDEAKAKGYDVGAAQQVVDDMGARLTAATTSADQASSSVAYLQPDQGNQSVRATNLAALAAGRQDLHGAWDDLQAARHDARTAIDDLEHLHK